MAELARLATPVANAAISTAAEQLAKSQTDYYNEDDIKEMLLKDLQIVKEDTKALLNKEFKTARDTLALIHASTESITSPTNMDRLRRADDCAAMAWNAVPDPLDKITSLSFLAFTNYHLVALRSRINSAPDWAAGKREVFSLLKTYLGQLPHLEMAADEELGSGGFRFPAFKDKKKRRNMLERFAQLMSNVCNTSPHSINQEIPRFERPEDALIKCCSNKNGTMLWNLAFLPRTRRPLLRGTLKGHDEAVYCCSFFQDGKRALSGSADKTLKLWDLTTGQELQTLKAHTRRVSCCSVFEDGKRALSGSQDKTLKVWDLTTGQDLQTLQGHTGFVWCCSIFQEGKRALSGSQDKTLRLWDLTTGQELQTLGGHTNTVSCCSVFQDGKRALSGSVDNTLKIWDLTTSQELQTTGHTNTVWCCSVFQDGKRALIGSVDKTLKLWDLPI